MYKGLNISVPAADLALKLAKGERKAAYSKYIQLYFEQTGSLDCGCDDKDLQHYYDRESVNK